MRPPIYVRQRTDAERSSVKAGLRSSDAFRLRRCQIVQASADRVPVPQIARNLGCNEQTVRNAIHAFNTQGTAALTKGSATPRTIRRALDGAYAERLRDLLHRSPREFGYDTSLWTLDLAAQEAFRQELTAHEVTGETIRATLVRLGVRWLRAKTWITSPDPEYLRKKGGATA
jgi:transposase